MKADPLDLLDRHYGEQPDRRGERHVKCPFCSNEPNRRKPNFSYSERGAGCYSCGHTASLNALCAFLGLTEDKYLPAPPAPRQRPPQRATEPFAWQLNPERLLETYTRHPRRVELWQQHKPLSAETIERWQLGVGKLPASSCKHERLILPVIEAGQVVGFRGRAIRCDCPKWLAPAGFTAHLFGREAVRPGGILWIVENNVDALLMMQLYPEYDAVASTHGCSTWLDEWTAHVASRAPRLVIVALDNDLPGNGGGKHRGELIRRWREEHPAARRLPIAWGPRIADKLVRAGLTTRLYIYPDGAPAKASVADLCQEAA